MNMRWMIVNLSNGIVLRYCNKWSKCQTMLSHFRSYPLMSKQGKEWIMDYYDLTDSAFTHAENIKIIPGPSKLIWSERDRKFTHILVSTLRRKAREGKLEEIMDPTKKVMRKGQVTLQLFDPMENEDPELQISNK